MKNFSSLFFSFKKEWEGKGERREKGGDKERSQQDGMIRNSWGEGPVVHSPVEGQQEELSTRGNFNIHAYRRRLCVAWAYLPLRKASGKQGLAHRTHAHGQVLLWGIRPALYLGHFETCFC